MKTDRTLPQEGHHAFLNFRLFQSCVGVWFLSYGIIIFAVEVTNYWVLLWLLIAPVITYSLIARFSLERASDVAVNEILGLDFKKESEKTDKSLSDILMNSVCANELGDLGFMVVKVIAHRFAGIDAPENSLQALEACYQKGCVAVEFDVALTVDKVPVIFHDNTTDRLTNFSGEVQKMTWNQLQTLDISVNHPFHDRFKGTKVALLNEVVDKCLEYDMRMIIDVKDFSSEMVQVICDLFDKRPALYMRAVVSSFSPFVIYAIRLRKPDIVGGMAWRPKFMSCCQYSPQPSECKKYYSSPFANGLAKIADHITTWAFNNVYYYVLGLSVVLINKNVITCETVNWWEARGIRLLAWTVNIPSEKVHFSKNLKVTYLTDTMAGD